MCSYRLISMSEIIGSLVALDFSKSTETFITQSLRLSGSQRVWVMSHVGVSSESLMWVCLRFLASGSSRMRV